MALLARPIRYIGSLLPTPNSATAGRRPLTPRTTTQVRLFKQLLDKRTGALLVLPQAATNRKVGVLFVVILPRYLFQYEFSLVISALTRFA